MKSKINWIAINHSTEHKYTQIRVRRNDREEPKAYENIGLTMCAWLDDLSNRYMITIFVWPKGVTTLIHNILK